MLSICLFVCLLVCLSPKCKKTRFSQKLSNLELWCLLTTYRKLVCKLNWAFQRTHYWISTIQDGWDPPSWKSTWRHFFLSRVVRFGLNFGNWCRMTCRLRWCGRNRNQMWTSNMADVWANSMACHPRATYHSAGCCHLVNSLSRFQSHMLHCRVQLADEINVVIVPHCRV